MVMVQLEFNLKRGNAQPSSSTGRIDQLEKKLINIIISNKSWEVDLKYLIFKIFFSAKIN